MLLRVVSSLAIALALLLPQFSRVSAAPAFSHIYVIMEENTSYDAIVGNTADAPYINSLISKYGFAANYYGVTHPSEPNYIASIAGDFFGLHADDPTFRSDATNLVDQLESKGLTWATYQQGLPSVGSTVAQDPATGTGLYVIKHDPFMLFNDVRNSATRVKNVKPMTSLATDLATGTAPNYSLIVPDQCHDMHGVSPPSATNYGMPWCGYPANFVIPHAVVQASDDYLKSLVTTIMTSPAWTSDSVIVVTWDENESSGLPNTGPTRGYAGTEGCCASPPGDGGGRVPTIVITNTPTHLVSLRPYNHYSLLRTIEDNWGLGCLANTCNSAVQPMTDLISPSPNATSLASASGFAVTFTSKNPGQGMIFFGPSCNALVEVGTRDITAGTTTHTVFVTGNDMPGTVGDIGITPGAQYYYEAVTMTPSGPEIDNNNGNCYTIYITKP
jgi:hypothetical protein